MAGNKRVVVIGGQQIGRSEALRLAVETGKATIKRPEADLVILDEFVPLRDGQQEIVKALSGHPIENTASITTASSPPEASQNDFKGSELIGRVVNNGSCLVWPAFAEAIAEAKVELSKRPVVTIHNLPEAEQGKGEDCERLLAPCLGYQRQETMAAIREAIGQPDLAAREAALTKLEERHREALTGRLSDDVLLKEGLTE